MRERPDRLIAFPFSLGCVSHASIAVVEDRPRRTKSLKSPSFGVYEDGDDESLKHSSRLSDFPKPSLSTGVNRLVKGFKSLSQLFMYEDEMEGLGMEMEIGCPTDVKHVAHIGWDGTTTTHLTTNDANPLIGWHHLFTPPQPPLSPLDHSQPPPVDNATS